MKTFLKQMSLPLSWAFLASLGLLLGCTRGDITEVPPRLTDSKEIPELQSRVMVPLAINLATLEERANEEVPQLIHEVDQKENGCLYIRRFLSVGCRLTGPIERNGRISIQGSDQAVRISIPVRAEITARSRSDVPAQTTARAEFTAHFTLELDFEEDWSPRISVTSDFNWDRWAYVNVVNRSKVAIKSGVS
jgi:hypothetical protein